MNINVDKLRKVIVEWDEEKEDDDDQEKKDGQEKDDDRGGGIPDFEQDPEWDEEPDGNPVKGDDDDGDGDTPSGGGEIPQPKLKSEVEDLGRYWEDKLKDSLNKNAGNMPGDLLRIIKELLAPRIDWKRELKKFITQLSRKTTDFLPDRRFIGSGQIQWGSKKSKTLIESVVIVCDTSGSMSEAALETAISEASGIMDKLKPKKTYVLWFDSTVYTPVDVLKPSEVAKLKKAYGGGGTIFQAPFEYIEKEILPKGKMGPVLFFTDGYPGNGWPTIDQYNIKSYSSKIIWIITHRNTPAVDVADPDFGTRLDLVHD